MEMERGGTSQRSEYGVRLFVFPFKTHSVLKFVNLYGLFSDRIVNPDENKLKETKAKPYGKVRKTFQHKNKSNEQRKLITNHQKYVTL
jgi:hypothetical protein